MKIKVRPGAFRHAESARVLEKLINHWIETDPSLQAELQKGLGELAEKHAIILRDILLYGTGYYRIVSPAKSPVLD